MAARPEVAPAAAHAYRREIDGLRAVAVLPVILFHAGLPAFAGGYLGVDVFFVISGYLITGILARDLRQGRFSLARFYERRARRILPALTAVLLACIPFAVAWMSPLQLEELARGFVAATLSVSNILYWLELDYFGPSAEPLPLLHTWSLGIEEQFYLLFPLALAGLWRLRRPAALAIVTAALAASLALAALATQAIRQPASSCSPSGPGNSCSAPHSLWRWSAPACPRRALWRRRASRFSSSRWPASHSASCRASCRFCSLRRHRPRDRRGRPRHAGPAPARDPAAGRHRARQLQRLSLAPADPRLRADSLRPARPDGGAGARRRRGRRGLAHLGLCRAAVPPAQRRPAAGPAPGRRRPPWRSCSPSASAASRATVLRRASHRRSAPSWRPSRTPTRTATPARPTSSMPIPFTRSPAAWSTAPSRRSPSTATATPTRSRADSGRSPSAPASASTRSPAAPARRSAGLTRTGAASSPDCDAWVRGVEDFAGAAGFDVVVLAARWTAGVALTAFDNGEGGGRVRRPTSWCRSATVPAERRRPRGGGDRPLRGRDRGSARRRPRGRPRLSDPGGRLERHRGARPPPRAVGRAGQPLHAASTSSSAGMPRSSPPSTPSTAPASSGSARPTGCATPTCPAAASTTSATGRSTSTTTTSTPSAPALYRADDHRRNRGGPAAAVSTEQAQAPTPSPDRVIA